MNRALGWGAFLTLGIILIILGVRGRLGSALGAIITPAAMEDVSNG